GSQTDVGSSDSTIASCTVTKGGEDVSANFDITTAKGTLTVTRAAITVTAPTPETKTYDGTALTANGLDPAVDGLPEGFEVVCTYSGSQTDVGSSDSTIASCTVTKGGEDVTANFDITKKTGTLLVTGRAITINTESQSYAREYDGLPIHPENTAPPTVIGEFVAGEVESVECSYAEQTDVGSVQIGYKVDWSGAGKPGNYDITLVPGTLTVTERNVTVHAGGGNFEYSGNVWLPNPYAFFTETGEWLDVEISEGVDTVTAVIKLIGGDRLTLVCKGYKELGTGYEVIQSESFTGNSGNYNIIYRGRIMNILIELSTDDPYPDD
ncbi:MAG: hypothetical protein IKN04_07365, partial [Clostridia bacterium]|nr:hypothetical protein [Clostridia bacterium]